MFAEQKLWYGAWDMPSKKKLKESYCRIHELECSLEAALNRQAATSEILKVIGSSPREVEPAFEAIVQAGLSLFPETTVSIALRDADHVRATAIAGPDNDGVEAWRKRFPAPLDPETLHGHVILNGLAIDVADVAAAQDRFIVGAGNFLASGYRAVTILPISHREDTVGALAVLRKDTGSLSPDQFQVLQTFVAQAEIAIANTRLLNDMHVANETLGQVSEQLAKYMPPQLYRAIIDGDQQASIVSQRKKLTIFFSDIADFAEITDQLEAEELTSLLNEYLSEMSTIAQEFGAYFDKFIGDAMMFYFGDADSRGVRQDGVACVRMAIAMQRRLSELQAGWAAQGFIDRPFQARIGINTGYCTVGNFGSESRMDHTIIGREVNLAARLEAEADPGGILLAQETYALVKDWLKVEEREAIKVKGFPKPIRTYAITGIYDGAEGHGDLVHYEDEFCTLTIDRDRMNSDQRAQVARSIRAILSDLER